MKQNNRRGRCYLIRNNNFVLELHKYKFKICSFLIRNLFNITRCYDTRTSHMHSSILLYTSPWLTNHIATTHRTPKLFKIKLKKKKRDPARDCFYIVLITLISRKCERRQTKIKEKKIKSLFRQRTISVLGCSLRESVNEKLINNKTF